MAGVVPPTTPPAGLVNASAWYNLTAWTVNVTRYAPSFEDLVWAGPRMVRKLGSFITFSEPLDNAAHPFGSIVSDSHVPGAVTPQPDLYNVMEPAIPVASAGLGDSGEAGSASRLSMEGARGLGSVFSYATSKWAISCIIMAVVLNRTHIFAATRRRLRLRWTVRLILRALPIVLLAMQARYILASIQCQTSKDFSEIRWGDPTRGSDLMFAHPNTFLNKLASMLLFGSTDEQSCIAAEMTPSDEAGSARDLRGSLSRLWPLFGTYCLSHFIETVSCAVQGRPITAETGMTLFEQSLAFAEADAAVSNQLGWRSFSKNTSPYTSTESVGTNIAITRSMVLRRVNTSPEVLLVAFLSTMTHLSSHVLGVFDLQAKYRLVNTGFWGLCFMGSIVWSAAVFDLDDPFTQGLLRYPTVCIIGFVPHVLVLAGIALCLSIYGLALLLSALAPPANQGLGPLSLRQRLYQAHENMQANVSLSDIRITREMDFYTALLRTGFAAITMASEAVYLNEDKGVSMKQHTWLEEARFKEIEEMQKHWIGSGLPNSQYDQIGAIGLIPVKGDSMSASSGYARERAAQKVPKGRGERGLRIGIGATERSSRWLMALEFLISVSSLVTRLSALSTLWFLRLIRIRGQPAWLLWLARRPKLGSEEGKNSNQEPKQRNKNHFLAYNDHGRIPRTDGIDVEAEFRRVDKTQTEEDLDQDLYKYWLKGGWWGSKDTSGDFEPEQNHDDFDTTSFISMSTTADGRVDDEDWETESGGQRTPTQQSRVWSREGTPVADNPMAMSDLAKLLHPTSPEEREDARNLAAHLQSDTILTRSSFRRLQQLQRTRILTNPASGILGAAETRVLGRSAKLNPDEEERLLEQLLLSRRQNKAPTHGHGDESWEQGAAGLGGDGPQCVVCQSTPRSIIVWPCRCLSLCDDCRVSLAMNNFDKCVCCRREVISFSRIFVP